MSTSFHTNCNRYSHNLDQKTKNVSLGYIYIFKYTLKCFLSNHLFVVQFRNVLSLSFNCLFSLQYSPVQSFSFLLFSCQVLTGERWKNIYWSRTPSLVSRLTIFSTASRIVPNRFVCVCVFIKLHIITAQPGPDILIFLCYSNVCVFIKLHITEQPGPDILIFLCYSNRCVCVCVYLLNCT